MFCRINKVKVNNSYISFKCPVTLSILSFGPATHTETYTKTHSTILLSLTLLLIATRCNHNANIQIDPKSKPTSFFSSTASNIDGRVVSPEISGNFLKISGNFY